MREYLYYFLTLLVLCICSCILAYNTHLFIGIIFLTLILWGFIIYLLVDFSTLFEKKEPLDIKEIEKEVSPTILGLFKHKKYSIDLYFASLFNLYLNGFIHFLDNNGNFRLIARKVGPSEKVPRHIEEQAVLNGFRANHKLESEELASMHLSATMQRSDKLLNLSGIVGDAGEDMFVSWFFLIFLNYQLLFTTLTPDGNDCLFCSDTIKRFFFIPFLSPFQSAFFIALIQQLFPSKKNILSRKIGWANRSCFGILIVLAINSAVYFAFYTVLISNFFETKEVTLICYTLFMISIAFLSKKKVIKMTEDGVLSNKKMHLLIKYLNILKSKDEEKSILIYKDLIPYAIALKMKGYSLEKNFDKIANLVFSDLPDEKRLLVISELKEAYPKAQARVDEEINKLMVL